MLGQERKDHGRILAPLSLVDGGGIGQHQFIQFGKIINDQPSVHFDPNFLVLGVNLADASQVAVEDFLIVVVAHLHHFVMEAVGGTTPYERFGLRIQGLLELPVQPVSADGAAIHGRQHLNIGDRIQLEARRDAIPAKLDYNL